MSVSFGFWDFKAEISKEKDGIRYKAVLTNHIHTWFQSIPVILVQLQMKLSLRVHWTYWAKSAARSPKATSAVGNPLN